MQENKAPPFVRLGGGFAGGVKYCYLCSWGAIDRPGGVVGSQFEYHLPNEQQCKGELDVWSV